jgi:hypothetical protein
MSEEVKFIRGNVVSFADGHEATLNLGELG